MGRCPLIYYSSYVINVSNICLETVKVVIKLQGGNHTRLCMSDLIKYIKDGRYNHFAICFDRTDYFMHFTSIAIFQVPDYIYLQDDRGNSLCLRDIESIVFDGRKFSIHTQCFDFFLVCER